MAWSSGQHRRLPLQGSKVRNSAIATSFFGNVPRANSSEEMRVAERARRARRKAGAKTGVAATCFESGMDSRKEKKVRLESD